MDGGRRREIQERWKNANMDTTDPLCRSGRGLAALSSFVHRSFGCRHTNRKHKLTSKQAQTSKQSAFAPHHSLCGMTSMSSRGGEAGEGSSKWLPRLTTCRAAGWAHQQRRAGRLFWILRRKEQVAWQSAPYMMHIHIQRAGSRQETHVWLAGQLVLDCRPSLL
jgi:hypothetical protein